MERYSWEFHKSIFSAHLDVTAGRQIQNRLILYFYHRLGKNYITSD